MTNKEALAELKELEINKETATQAGKAILAAIEALEKQIRIQEIMAMPIQENAVKYLAICGVMDK